MSKLLKTTEAVKEYFINLHDAECNQKYATYLTNPLNYSFHLEMVVKQAQKFNLLIQNDDDFTNIVWGCWGHDAIEDARQTYNDVKDVVGYDVAEIIYLCTESKGRTRSERHSDEFYAELSTNRLAIFVKLCDIIANVKFGLLTNSTMYLKYQNEYSKTKSFLYRDEFKDMFDYLEELLKINNKK